MENDYHNCKDIHHLPPGSVRLPRQAIPKYRLTMRSLFGWRTTPLRQDCHHWKRLEGCLNRASVRDRAEDFGVATGLDGHIEPRFDLIL